MINFITSNISAIVGMFVQWAETLQARARDPTQANAGAVIYILIAAPVLVFGLYELVTILTNFFRTRSNDRYPLMSHADNMAKAGKNPLRFYGLGSSRFYRRGWRSSSKKKKAMTEQELLAAYMRKRKAREKGEVKAEEAAMREEQDQAKQLQAKLNRGIKRYYKKHHKEEYQMMQLANLMYQGKELRARHEAAMERAATDTQEAEEPRQAAADDGPPAPGDQDAPPPDEE